MTTCCVSYYERPDGVDLVDMTWQDSIRCMDEQLIEDGVHTADIAGERNIDHGPEKTSISWGPYPCGAETDYDVYCSQCGELMWRGLQSEEES